MKYLPATRITYTFDHLTYIYPAFSHEMCLFRLFFFFSFFFFHQEKNPPRFSSPFFLFCSIRVVTQIWVAYHCMLFSPPSPSPLLRVPCLRIVGQVQPFALSASNLSVHVARYVACFVSSCAVAVRPLGLFNSALLRTNIRSCSFPSLLHSRPTYQAVSGSPYQLPASFVLGPKWVDTYCWMRLGLPVRIASLLVLHAATITRI